jgi:hypothetical protein
MGSYHGIAAHFPIALWITAFLIILLSTFSESTWVKNLQRVLPALLFFGFLTGLITFIIGLFVWPWAANISSPLVRNHLLMAGWALIYWGGLWLFIWKLGDLVWQGLMSYVMVVMALLGVVLLSIAGTLGGSLIGNPSTLPDILALLGWDINSTFYLPNAMLLVIVISCAVMLFFGYVGNKNKT